MQWSPVSELSGAWYSALEVGLATPILWQAWKEMPGGLCYSLQVPSLWVRKAVALHGHYTSTIILAPHQPTEKEAEQERGEERRKLSESLFLWSTETVKILAEDSKSPPFLQQSLLVLHVNSWWSKPYWIKKIARFYVYKLYIVLLRKEGGWRAEHQVLLGFGDLRGFFIMICYSEALLVKTDLVDVPQVLWTACWGTYLVQIAQCADSSAGWGLSSGTGGHGLALALCTMAQGPVVPARWPDTLRHSRSWWLRRSQAIASTDCEDVKVQGVLCSGSLPGGTRSNCDSLAAPW